MFIQARKCSRWQFECHSGECIAIYNACDGIPQCNDSSDEDPKLGCPTGTPDNGGGGRHMGDMPPGVDGGPVGGGGQGGDAPWDKQQPPREVNPVYDGRIFRNRPTILENYGSYQQSGGPMEEASVYGDRSRPPSYYSPNQRPPWPVQPYTPGDGSGRAGEYLGNDPRPQQPYRYPEYGPQQQPQQHYPQPYLPPLPPQQQQQQPQQQQPVWMDGSNYNSQHSPQQLHQQMQDLHHVHPSTLQQQQQQHQQQGMVQQQEGQYMQQHPGLSHQPSSPVGAQNTELGMTGGTNARASPADISPPASSPSVSAPLPVTPATPPSGGQNSSSNNSINSKAAGTDASTGSAGGQQAVDDPRHPVKAVAHASLARLEVNLEELEVEAREQDAQASGAILALAMGVCITALLVVLVGCRLRGVRRRLRRHRGARSPYAHDADYLVNGMYL